MKILEASKVREADQYTIDYEPIESINLMERAAWKCCNWIFNKCHKGKEICVLVGPGNNGGDGLAIARILADGDYNVQVYVQGYEQKHSDDFLVNYSRIESISSVRVANINSHEQFPVLNKEMLVIDALYGSGLSRPLSDLAADLVTHINASSAKVISIDLPSGLFGEDNLTPFNGTEVEKPIVMADYTLTFEFPFLSFFFPENVHYVGRVVVLPIGIHPQFIAHVNTKYQTIEEDTVRNIFKQRQKFAHKGTFGHAISFAGSYGKIGAATLAAQAALRSGVGLLTCHVPHSAYEIMQISVPEAIASVDPHEYHISQLPDLQDYSAVGVGPGLGLKTATCNFVQQLLNSCNKPLVVDADGLNIIAQKPELLDLLPEGSVLTPHPKEFERLFGKPEGGYSRLLLLSKIAEERKLVIVLKGAHTAVALPNGHCYFNTTGNPGMATAGSGDSLFGIILSFLAQGYATDEAALLAVYFHGLAGDKAVQKIGQYSLTASDITSYLGEAFLHFEDI